MTRIRVGIINVTGYIGADIARILFRHPAVEVVCVTGRSAAGKRLAEVFPHFQSVDMTIAPDLDVEVDVVFSAMPHKASAEACGPLLERGVRVVDASADFRLKDAGEYQKWYQVEHPYPDLLKSAVYGLTEVYHSSIATAALVANPGCYPTGALLALAPALAAGIIEGDIIVDSKSGVSGAGRSLTLTTHYAECNESVAAYAVSGHRHMPEILQECRALDERVNALLFLPHLVPMSRGILSSCYARVDLGALQGGGYPDRTIREIYREYYRTAAFVKVVDAPPATKHVWGSNYCHVFPAYDQRTGRLLVLSAIDNLVKGGAGEAVQNMNLMLGLEETAGLESLPVFP